MFSNRRGFQCCGPSRREASVDGQFWTLTRTAHAAVGRFSRPDAAPFLSDVPAAEHAVGRFSVAEACGWVGVHLVAQGLGLNTNATILCGHIDQRRERLVKMEILRRAQDGARARLGYEGDPADFVEAGLPATEGISAPPITLTREGVEQPTAAMSDRGGYFQTIIPLPFFPDGSELEHLYGPSGLENLRTLAIARLMLDNFPHVKAFWIMQTLAMAQHMLQCGADDIDGTVVWYDITKVGGSSTHQETTVLDLQRAIREAGFEPVERDTLYRRVERDGKSWRVG